ncbi:MAG: ATP-binding protein [Vicinamibacterales bacterium]
MSRLSLRVRLVVWYLAVLAPAFLVLAIGSEWLVRRSLVGTMDMALSSRIESVRLFVENAERENLSPVELRDEFLEWAQLTNGEVPVEVTGSGGEVFCTVQRPGWQALSAHLDDPLKTVPPEQWLDGAPVRVKLGRLVARDNTYRVLVAAPMDQTIAAVGRFHTALLFLLPSVLIAAAAGGYWISGRALAPVGRMTREVQAITVRNLERRVEVPQTDVELQRLAHTFNAMLSRLQVSVEDLSRLTADASHELRTPVTLVRTTADVALSRDRTPAEYRDALGEVLSHSERMSYLVDDLLALARADAGVESRDDEGADVIAAVRLAVEDVRASAERARLTVTVTAEAPEVLAAASAESIRRLLVIVLSNAVRYTPEGGRVAVSVAGPTPAQHIEIHVSDTGIGIDRSERAHVFDRFYRGASARAVAADGSGLGLAIARSIVAAHGGTIEIVDSPAGLGCDVQITLPPSY